MQNTTNQQILDQFPRPYYYLTKAHSPLGQGLNFKLSWKDTDFYRDQLGLPIKAVYVFEDTSNKDLESTYQTSVTYLGETLVILLLENRNAVLLRSKLVEGTPFMQLVKIERGAGVERGYPVAMKVATGYRRSQPLPTAAVLQSEQARGVRRVRRGD